jgi:hypothetical protein
MNLVFYTILLTPISGSNPVKVLSKPGCIFMEQCGSQELTWEAEENG